MPIKLEFFEDGYEGGPLLLLWGGKVADVSSLVKPNRPSADSWWAVAWELVSARVLIWLASVGKPCELTPEGHWYLFDRYRRLAAYYRQRGELTKASRYELKANEHDVGDNGPYAAAMAMPRPRRFVQVNAVSTQRFGGHDDVA